MHKTLSLSLTNDTWTQIPLTDTCYAYGIQARERGLGFKIRKDSSDTDGFPVYSKRREDGTPRRARISASSADGYGAAGEVLCEIQALSRPVNVDVFLG